MVTSFLKSYIFQIFIVFDSSSFLYSFDSLLYKVDQKFHVTCIQNKIEI